MDSRIESEIVIVGDDGVEKPFDPVAWFGHASDAVDGVAAAAVSAAMLHHTPAAQQSQPWHIAVVRPAASALGSRDGGPGDVGSTRARSNTRPAQPDGGSFDA